MTALLATVLPLLKSTAAGFVATRIAKRFPVLWGLFKGVKWLKNDAPPAYVKTKNRLGETVEFSAEAYAAMSDDDKRAIGILPEKTDGAA